MRGTHWGKGTIGLQAAVLKWPHTRTLTFFFRITRDPSSGSSIQCLAKIRVMALSHLLMDIVGVMAAYLSMVRVCAKQSSV